MRLTKRGYLRALGYAEGSSLLLLLLVATPLKWFAQIQEPARILGTLHGFLFLMYIVTLLTTGPALGLTRKQVWFGLTLSAVPFGTFVFDRTLVDRPNWPSK